MDEIYLMQAVRRSVKFTVNEKEMLYFSLGLASKADFKRHYYKILRTAGGNKILCG